MPSHTNVNRFRGRHVFLSRENLIRMLFRRFNGEHKSWRLSVNSDNYK